MAGDSKCSGAHGGTKGEKARRIRCAPDQRPRSGLSSERDKERRGGVEVGSAWRRRKPALGLASCDAAYEVEAARVTAVAT